MSSRMSTGCSLEEGRDTVSYLVITAETTRSILPWTLPKGSVTEGYSILCGDSSSYTGLGYPRFCGPHDSLYLGCVVGWEKTTDEPTINRRGGMQPTINRHGGRQPTNRRSKRRSTDLDSINNLFRGVQHVNLF
jgi:hypothetical protein